MPMERFAPRVSTKKMIMIIHEAVGMAKPMVAFVDMDKDFEKNFPVKVVLEYCLFLVPTRRYVIQGTVPKFGLPKQRACAIVNQTNG